MSPDRGSNDSAMTDFIALEQVIRRSSRLAAGLCAILLLVTIGSLTFALCTVWSAGRSVARMPVLVVPGAVAGVYSPGLTEDNVRAAARYLAGLGTSFSGVHSMDQRFDELESFASPEFLPRLQAARLTLRRDVETQSQARAFYGVPESEKFGQLSPGKFEYAIQGRRVVYASGLTMDSRGTLVNLKLALGAPSEKNRTGVLLDGFEVSDLPAETPAAARQ
jgi:hypothetical protein